MISRKLAEREVNRLAGTNFFGALKDPAIAELVQALRSSRNEIVAVATINEWLAGSSERPTPADLYRIIAAIEHPSKEWQRPKDWGEPEAITDAERAEWAALNERIAEGNRRRIAEAKARREATAKRSSRLDSLRRFVEQGGLAR